jgi:hypothetical protein
VSPDNLPWLSLLGTFILSLYAALHFLSTLSTPTRFPQPTFLVLSHLVPGHLCASFGQPQKMLGVSIGTLVALPELFQPQQPDLQASLPLDSLAAFLHCKVYFYPGR